MTGPNPAQLDPWAGGPRRGVFVTDAERLDPVLTRAAHADPARAFVTLSPAWLAAVVEALAGAHRDILSGALDDAGDLAAVLECSNVTFLPPDWQTRVAEPNGRSRLQERFAAIRQLLED